MNTRSGHCLCGEVQFTATGKPHSVGYCCCRMCQTSVGAPAVPWATYPSAAVQFNQDKLIWYRSSAKAERGFCAKCGASVVWRRTGGKFIDLALALFEPPDALKPVYAIWTSAKPAWLKLDDELKQFAEGHNLEPE